MSQARRTRRTIALIVVLTLAVLAGFSFALSQLGIPLLPATAAEPAPPAPAPSALPIATLSDSPAVVSIRAILDSNTFGGYSPDGPINWAVGTPYDYACHLSAWKGAGSAISAQRAFVDSAASGAPATPTPSTTSASASPEASTPAVLQSNAITVSLHAYGAGAGAANFAQLIDRVNSCPQRDASVASDTTSVNGADAIVGRVLPNGSPVAISSITWRRGDVIIDVHAVDRSDGALATFAAKVDEVATQALTGVCASITSSIEDGVRSPWVDRNAFTGLVANESVTVTPTPTPAAPAGVTPRDPASPLSPIPSVSIPDTRPADPIWPPELPAPVATPVAPSAPATQPTSAPITFPADDPIGPGCGWKFTSQLAPVFDAQAANEAKSKAQTQARAAITAGQLAWSQALVAYWTAAAAYDQGLITYSAYANQVQQVVAAWNAIQQARDAYALQVAQWKTAVSERDTLIAAQQRAMLDFQAAVTTCLTSIPITSTTTSAATPTDAPPTPLPTDVTPTPTVTTSPPATQTPPPSPSACPPTRPAILDQPVPTAPASPLPPPDPRPSVSASTTR